MTVEINYESYWQSRRSHWDAVARKMESWTGWGKAYHKRLAQIYGFWVAPGQRVLEVGCGSGDLLAALRPSCGVGVDFSTEMVQRARTLHPDIEFIEADGHDLRSLLSVFSRFNEEKDKPKVVICKTVRGKGVSFMENSLKYHSCSLGEEEYRKAMEELC